MRDDLDVIKDMFNTKTVLSAAVPLALAAALILLLRPPAKDAMMFVMGGGATGILTFLGAAASEEFDNRPAVPAAATQPVRQQPHAP